MPPSSGLMRLPFRTGRSFSLKAVRGYWDVAGWANRTSVLQFPDEHGQSEHNPRAHHTMQPVLGGWHRLRKFSGAKFRLIAGPLFLHPHCFTSASNSSYELIVTFPGLKGKVTFTGLSGRFARKNPMGAGFPSYSPNTGITSNQLSGTPLRVSVPVILVCPLPPSLRLT